jgi:chromosome segregation ATPase
MQNAQGIQALQRGLDQTNMGARSLEQQTQQLGRDTYAAYQQNAQGVQQLRGSDATTADEIERLSRENYEDREAEVELRNEISSIRNELNQFRQRTTVVTPSRATTEAPLPSDYEMQIQEHQQQLLDANQANTTQQQLINQLQNQLTMLQQQNQQLQAQCLASCELVNQLPTFAAMPPSTPSRLRHYLPHLLLHRNWDRQTLD